MATPKERRTGGQRWERRLSSFRRLPGVAAIGGMLVLVAFDLVMASGRSLWHPVAASGLVITAAVALQRRHLLGAATVAVATSLATSAVNAHLGAGRGLGLGLLPSLTAVVGVGVLTGAIARRSAAVPGVTLGLAATAAVAFEAHRLGRSVDALALSAVFAGFTLSCVAAGLYLRWLEWRQDQQASSVRLAERVELARELHDVVAHHVTGMVVQAQGARVVAALDPAAAASALVAIERAGAEALSAMRGVVSALRAPPDDSPRLPGGASGLRELVARAADLGVPVRLALSGVELEDLPADVTASVHRIVQESFTNIERHAGVVSAVDVELSRSEVSLLVTVRDDGRAGQARTGGGFGLLGMGERAAALGGTLSAGPRPDQGWEVRASLPLAGRP